MLGSSLIVAVITASSVVSAQPAPAPSVPAPYQYQPQPTPDEQETLNEGEVSPQQIHKAVLTTLLFGFGTGEYVEGRWHESGQIFTAMDSIAAATMAISVGSMISGFMKCLTLAGPGLDTPGCDNTNPSKGIDPMVWVFVGGAILRVASGVGQLIDVTSGAHAHNRRVRALRDRYGLRAIAKTITPYVSRPQSSDGGMTAGIALRF